MAKNNFKRKKKPGVVRRILPYFVIILVAAALIVAVILITSRKGNKDRQEIQTVVDVTENQNNNNNQIQSLEKDGVPEVKELVQKYFDAVKKADVKDLKQIVVQDTEFSEEALKKQCEYVESYENIICYTVPGIADNTYIAYVYYEIFVRIRMEACILIRMRRMARSQLICKRLPDGSPCVNWLQM